MFRAVTSNLPAFGLISGAGPACTQPAGIPSGWATMCSATSTVSTLVSPNAQQTHLFADDIHLSTAGQKIVADYEYGLIVAPNEISFLAEAPVKTREALIEGMLVQIAISQRQRSVGSFNTWITGSIASLALDSGQPGFPNDPGIPVSATVGADYAFAPGWLAGAAISVGTTTQTFSLGGNFQQNELALSGYTTFLPGLGSRDRQCRRHSRQRKSRRAHRHYRAIEHRLDQRHQFVACGRGRIQFRRRAVQPRTARRHAGAASSYQRLHGN